MARECSENDSSDGEVVFNASDSSSHALCHRGSNLPYCGTESLYPDIWLHRARYPAIGVAVFGILQGARMFGEEKLEKCGMYRMGVEHRNAAEPSGKDGVTIPSLQLQGNNFKEFNRKDEYDWEMLAKTKSRAFSFKGSRSARLILDTAGYKPIGEHLGSSVIQSRGAQSRVYSRTHNRGGECTTLQTNNATAFILLQE
ncbi:hypothetical protein FB451DRAFT_1367001 [Mycena latifolia]|nr:hypothetical protein FB451DRAFT_1367001 [Mycena latifolia]